MLLRYVVRHSATVAAPRRDGGVQGAARRVQAAARRRQDEARAGAAPGSRCPTTRTAHSFAPSGCSPLRCCSSRCLCVSVSICWCLCIYILLQLGPCETLVLPQEFVETRFANGHSDAQGLLIFDIYIRAKVYIENDLS